MRKSRDLASCPRKDYTSHSGEDQNWDLKSTLPLSSSHHHHHHRQQKQGRRRLWRHSSLSWPWLPLLAPHCQPPPGASPFAETQFPHWQNGDVTSLQLHRLWRRPGESQTQMTVNREILFDGATASVHWSLNEEKALCPRLACDNLKGRGHYLPVILEPATC